MSGNVPRFVATPVVAPMTECKVCAPRAEEDTRVLTCYTPLKFDGTVSCLTVQRGARASMTTDARLAVIPENSIIDRVEYFGVDNFSTKECFYIGLGQLNDQLSFPLVHSGKASIANEKIGGCRDFFSARPDGETEKSVVLYASNVNVIFDAPVTNGGLVVRIQYRLRPNL